MLSFTYNNHEDLLRILLPFLLLFLVFSDQEDSDSDSESDSQWRNRTTDKLEIVSFGPDANHALSGYYNTVLNTTGRIEFSLLRLLCSTLQYSTSPVRASTVLCCTAPVLAEQFLFLTLFLFHETKLSHYCFSIFFAIFLSHIPWKEKVTRISRKEISSFFLFFTFYESTKYEEKE